VAGPPPYRIETERLVVRCWEPRDAAPLTEAIDESVEHLSPWMPWVHHEPQTVDDRVELLRRFRGEFDLGTDFVYGILAPDDVRVVGGSGLHTRVGDAAVEIGYWIRVSETRKGYASEAVAALTHAATLRRRQLPLTEGAERRDLVVFSMLVEEAAGSPVAAVPFTAYDAAGRPAPRPV
jgi:RimJ/RimL family protein N-acetyltransferase